MSEGRPVALVTGSTRGIGLGVLCRLAEQDYRVVMNGVRDATQAADALRRVREHGPAAIYVRGDVSLAAERAEMLDAIRDQFGRLDVLVNNAGIASPGRKDILDADEAGFDRVLAINLKGAYFLTQAAARWMIARKVAGEEFPASIVNISSLSAEVASVNRGDYCISKAGLNMATRLWAVRLAEFGIPVYEVQPGIIRTDMTAPVAESYDRLIADGLTLERRWGTPDDVAQAVAALVRGDLPYATGTVLRIDGGMLVRRL